jgi:PII-like signaling protein
VNEPAIKLTTYFAERQRSGTRFLADALFDLYERHQMRTSVLLRGAAGFGQHHHLHSDRLLTLSETLPAVSIAVDVRERVEHALREVTSVVGHGLITLERARLISDHDDRAVPPVPDGRAMKLTLYGGRSIRAAGQTGYVAAVEELKSAGVAGASVLLGVDGTLHGDRRRARFLGRNANVPLMLSAIGSAEAFGAALPQISRLLDDPIATIERVQICKSNGTVFGEPQTSPDEDPSGLPIHVKLEVQVEEPAMHGRHPVHLALLRRLREAGAPGATVLRGIRGFYADRGPFADRLHSLRRNVPVHLVVIDRPRAVPRWWEIIDELTAEHGLVTAELVPASLLLSAGHGGLQLASTRAARES